MKLNRITMTNFLRVPDVDIDLSGAQVHLFCGANEAGKSSIAEAVLFALTGETERVELKKNYPQLIHQGAKKGAVTIQFDDQQITRDVGSGKTEDETGFSEVQATCARIALGAQGFTDLDLKQRRAVLFELMQVTMDAATLVPRLEEKGVPAAIIERLKPLLLASVEAAAKAAGDEVSRLRGRWEQQAGEKWGSQKAEGWAPVFVGKRPVATSEADLTSMREAILKFEAQETEAIKALGKLEGDTEKRAELLRRAEQIKLLAHNLPVLQRDLASVTKQRDELAEWLSLEEEMIEKAANASKIHSCPGCDAALTFVDDELAFADPEALNFKTDDSLDGRRAEVKKRRAQLAEVIKAVEAMESKVAAGAQAPALQSQLKAQIDAIDSGAHLEDARNAVAKLRAALVQARTNVNAALEANRAIEHAAHTQKVATELHESIKAWTAAAQALAPSGIPADLLNDSLDTINRRMMASAKLAGWLAPEITPEMDVVREDGLAYGLLSESAQWRISAVVADAIATLAGMRVLLLDRMDVLDMPGRAQCLDWSRKLAADSYDAVMLFATLKEPPKTIPSGVRVYWMREGELAFQQDAQDEAA